MIKEDRKNLVLFLVFSLLGVWLAITAYTATARYHLAFLWGRHFQILIKVIFTSAFCILIFRLITRRPLPQKTIKAVYGILLLPLLLLPVFRCCFKVPYVFCRVCPDKCPWGISRTFLFSAFITLNLSGRFWCYFLCPFGTFQECQTRVSRVNIEFPFSSNLLAYPILLLTGWAYSLTLLGSQVVVYFAFGYYNWVGLTVFIAFPIIASAFFIPKFWCRFFCPFGAIAELFSVLRRKIFEK